MVEETNLHKEFKGETDRWSDRCIGDIATNKWWRRQIYRKNYKRGREKQLKILADSEFLSKVRTFNKRANILNQRGSKSVSKRVKSKSFKK